MESMDKHGKPSAGKQSFPHGCDHAGNPSGTEGESHERGNPILPPRRNEIDHARRDKKVDLGKALSWADVERIPDVIEQPKAVLLDTQIWDCRICGYYQSLPEEICTVLDGGMRQ